MKNLKNSKLFSISILCLLQIIIKVNAQLSPSYRKLHSAVLVEKKLYIFGGFNSPNLAPENEVNYNKSPDDRFFYLDVSISFDTSNLPWRSVSNNVDNLPLGSLSSVATGGVAASIGGVNNDMIFFFNNERDNATKSDPPVHSYNSPNNVWNTQIFSGNNPIGRNQMRIVTDYNGKVYLLTGFDFTIQGVTRSSGLFVCDTINLDCVIKDAPFPRLGYGATLLPNGMIIYIGGGDRNYVPIRDGFRLIYLYDPANVEWIPKVTTGKKLSDDVGFTTVLGLNGDRIILYGGNNNNDDNNLYVLNLTNYEWFVPKVRGKGPQYKRGEHCANVIGKYMVITFGSNGVLDAKYKEDGESDVLLLDISDDSEYVWTTSFDPTPLKINSTPSNSLSLKPATNNTSIIVGLTIGLILFICILSGITIFYIRYKNSNKAIPTPGNVVKDGDIITIPSDYELSHGKYRI
ncbi:uncharacterized protein OCT59_018391 [Rhizophagus irregularis]|uniref:Galactose oxidase n=2 Tax=Rhizophagus irregularis TaxID=588596 RepID=A0A015IEW5_RHIIW|nr:hypothetical protein GLOIN_2v1875867 [Rhizophagus irregularis DAOM 181602=DAOM 197198]EXX52535.1 hypothetical protein RirG_252300 [Rhizophagus irregularis DAOM 197198w]POG71627.1 hypothetical protein GLOIN_2v1875867 [Rhizophagus irregularis DAOM 181602=DAOM 197198]UZO26145.1 hypothetical protein OCT59_018391 [Rhizophagus irregularis]|eukprot:XP_025178493.1 hypothetical protein GLOIN_2v1875867 [Rhizophagus irregularis DAOM 181602=DAOM 197198]